LLSMTACCRTDAVPQQESWGVVMNKLIVRLMAALQSRRQDGQAMVEYALILALVSVVAIVMLTLVGTDVNDIYNNVATRLTSAV
jgi:pilus assembly protein Flp/PilA